MIRFHPSMTWHEPDSSQAPDGTETQGAADSALSSAGGKATPRNESGTRPDSGGSEFNDATLEVRPQHATRQCFFLPLHYESNYAYPLIVWLHNDGFNENQVDQVMPHVSVRNYLAVGVRGVRAADSVGHRFDWAVTRAGIAAASEAVGHAVEEACRHFSVHAGRVFLAGYGSGGTMAQRIAMRDPDRFAGVVSLSGGIPSGNHVLANLSELRRRRLPMLWLRAMGSASFNQAAVDAEIRQAMLLRARVEVRLYPGENEMDTVVLADMNRWLAAQVSQGATAESRWTTSPTAYSAN